MKLVRFLTHYANYNGGEVAGFPAERAAALVALKVAVYQEGEVGSQTPRAPGNLPGLREISEVSQNVSVKPVRPRRSASTAAVAETAPTSEEKSAE